MGASRQCPAILLVFCFLTWDLIAFSKANRHLYLRPGAQLSINCSGSRQETRSVALVRNWAPLCSWDPGRRAGDSGRVTVAGSPGDSGRVTVAGTLGDIRFTLRHISESDSGIYYCRYRSADADSDGRATLVAVTGDIPCKPPPPNPGPPEPERGTLVFLSTALLGVCVFAYVVTLFICVAPKVKKCLERKAPSPSADGVYEVMRMHVRDGEGSKC